MENLQQIETITKKIKTAPVAAIKALHLFIFENEGDRSNRRRLREFKGFDFHRDSNEHVAKLVYGQRLIFGDLVSCCNILSLDYGGSKEELIQRLCNGLMDLNSLTKTQEDEETDDETDEEVRNRDTDSENANSNGDSEKDNDSVRAANRSVKFAMNYRDIEDSIRIFDGSDAYPIERWITDFEDAASLFNWSELEKIVFAKKSLTGLAKLHVQSESIIKTWAKLKDTLLEEFAIKINSAELHRMLESRKMKREESVQEYYLVMKELASRGNIENNALFQYVIDGIESDTYNKIILYGAKSLHEFKEKIKVYETIRKKNHDKNRSGRNKEETTRTMTESTRKTETTKATDAARQMWKKEVKSEMRCYNCGGKGHLSKDCKNRALGKKCFKCQKYGHTSHECTDKPEGKSSLSVQSCSANENDTLSVKNNMCKNIFINGICMTALIDTGSQVTMIREIMLCKIGSKLLHNSTISLSGFGKNETKTLGYIQTSIRIDDEEFPVTIYVVPNDSMNIDAIIGCDILNSAELTINANGIIIRKVMIDTFLTQISLSEEQSLDLDHIQNKVTHDEVQKLITTYEPKKCKTTEIEMRIILKDEKPIGQNPRRLPVVEKNIVEKQVEEWIENKIIEPCTSEYASPVVVVKKKDGSPRVCIDFRKLNRIIEKDKYPLPLIEELLDSLQNTHVFSTIDLKNGVFHANVEEESRKYTAFVTHCGQHQFLKMPFGLCNSPSVFQRFVNHIFRDLVKKGIVLLYMDDVIILASDEKEAVTRLQLVLQTASEYGLQINFKKCKFVRRRIEFLGHIIEEGQVYPSDDKIKAVIKFPEPKGLKDVQSFLGLSGYFRKFIPNYSIIARPLTDMLQKDKSFQFGEKERNAICELKTILTRNPVLKIYNPNLETELHTDACKEGYGAVLVQKSPDDGCLHPVYYMSRKTKKEEHNYSSYELEALAIVKALEKFRIYLLGIEFRIITDCAAFQRTMSKKDLVTRIARWALFLQDFNYSIEHRAGTKMKHVDALSRNPVMMITRDNVKSKVQKLQEDDNELRAIVEILKHKPYEDYCLRNGILYKFVDGKELLVVPRVMQSEIIRTAHEKGHYAIRGTEELVKQNYFISNLKRKIEQHIASCISCITMNKKQGKQEGFLHPLTKIDMPLHTYHVDHLGPLDSTSKNYNHIFVVIDSFTKFVWLHPTKSTTTREVLSKLDVQKCIFGNPVQIISDRGTAFTSQEFADYCKQESIRHILITTGLPRANGQVERLNRTIISVLSKLSISEPTKWYKYVNKLQRTLNSSFQRSINMTPFELLFGVKMRNDDDLKLKEMIDDEFMLQFKENRDDLRQTAKEQILKLQQENEKTFNRKRKKALKYQKGDLVVIKRTQLGPGRKLRAKYLGPYRIIKVKNNDTYDVEKLGTHEGPVSTSTCAEYLKPYLTHYLSAEDGC